MAREEKQFDIEFEEISRRTRVVTVYATSKTAAIKAVRDENATLYNRRSTAPVVSRQCVKEYIPNRFTRPHHD